MQPFLAARIVLFFVARKKGWTSRIQVIYKRMYPNQRQAKACFLCFVYDSGGNAHTPNGKSAVFRSCVQ